MLLFTPFAIMATVLYLIMALSIWMKKRTPLRRRIILSVFFVYLLVVGSITLFPLPYQKNFIDASISNGAGQSNNFIPFKTILPIITQNSLLSNIFLTNIVGNILLFAPFGFLCPLIFRKLNMATKVIWIGFAASLLVESSQLIISSIIGFTYRSFDVDDLIVNTLGVIVGYVILRVLQLLVGSRLSSRFSKRTWWAGIPIVVIISFGIWGYKYFTHSTPQKALASYDSNVGTVQTIPFAKGVVLITPTDPSTSKQPGYIAWYMKKSFWGWRLKAMSKSLEGSPRNYNVDFKSVAVDGKTLVWGTSGRRIQEIIYRDAGQTYVCRIGPDSAVWNLILPFPQSVFPRGSWTMVLLNGRTVPLT